VKDDDSLVSRFDSLLLDLDGVIYVGSDPVPHATASLLAAAKAGVRLVYVTNNASRPPNVVADQLASMRLPADVADVVTSAQAGATLVSQQVEPGARVLAVGGPGVAAALKEKGLIPVDAQSSEMPDAGDDVVAVLQGFGKTVNWAALARASRAILDGVIWVATNDDMSIPTPYGLAPGNGALVAAVATATGTTPEVVGKPNPPLFQEAVGRTGGSLKPLVVGDRIDTDIQGAANSDMESLLVFTGVSQPLDLWRAPVASRPDHVGDDLRALLEPPLRVHFDDEGATCGDSWAGIRNRRLEVTPGTSPAAAAWAAAQVIWRAGTVPDNAPDVAAGLLVTRSEDAAGTSD